MSVCRSCAAFGTELRPPSEARLRHVTAVNTPQRTWRRTPAAERILKVDFGRQLRAARERRALSPEEAAKQLSIQQSTLRHYEAGSMRPDEKTAARLERFYAISLHDEI